MRCEKQPTAVKDATSCGVRSVALDNGQAPEPREYPLGDGESWPTTREPRSGTEKQLLRDQMGRVQSNLRNSFGDGSD